MVTIKPTTDSFYPTSSNHFEPPHTRTLRFTFLFLILFTSVVLLGVQIPLSYCSRGASLSLQVLIEYRGAFEREIERDITIPLENALSEIQGLKEIVSISEPGQSRIHLYLSDGSSLEDAYLETRDAVDRLYMLFPSSVQRPLILRSDPKNEPVFIAAFPLNGDLSEDDLKRRFQTVDGVGEVEVGGGTKEETVIRWFVEKGLSTKLTLSETVEVLRGWNVSGGVVLTPGTSLKLQSLLPNSESIGQVSLRTILRVKDVAEVVNRPVYRERRARVNGKELLVLYLKPTGEANLLRLSEQLTRICRSIPGSSVLYDQGGMIRSALNELFWALGIGVTSVGILTGIFLKSLLPSLLVSLSIPFSTFAALAVLHLLGKTLDVVSLSALTVGSGLVIDSGVILTERLFQERNGSLKEVLSEVKDPILLSTITTVGVFVPLIFAPPSIRLQFEPLAFTLSAQLGASLIYSLVFLPLFLARHRSRRTSIHLPNFFSGLKSRLECFYRIVHSHPLQVRISIIGGFVFLFGGGITFLLLLPKGEARLHDRTQLDFLIEFESGIPLEQVMAQSDALERFLSQHPCVAQVRVKYERERANFAIQLSTDKQGPEKDKNQKTLSTLSIPQKRLRLLQEIRHWASRIPHGFLFLPDSSREGSSISVVLSGEDALALQDTALSFARFIQSPREPMEIVFHFKDSLPSKRIIIDPQKANHFGLTPSMIRDYLYTSLSEPVIDKCITHDGETDIRLSFSHPWIRDSKSLVSLPLPSFHGIGVRLIDVGSMVEKNTPRRIYRTNRRRSVSFTVLSDLKDPSDLLTTLKAASEKYPFPEGVTVEIGKEWQETYHMFHQNLFLLGLSFIVLFLILGAYYQGLTYPVLVILQLPLFLSFALWALWIFQIPLSLSVAVGLLLTGGIGVNNALLVFPLSRRPIYASKPIDSDTMKDDFSLLRRFRHSFRSMLTATLTTLAGILPLLFQGNILTSQTPLQTTPFVGISLVVGAGSIGSLLVLWGMVILLEPNRPKG